MWEEIHVKIPSFEAINEKVREFLRDKVPHEDVVVRISPNQFFGLWKWSEEQQSHRRIDLVVLRKALDVVSFVRSIGMFSVDERLIR